MVETPLLNKIKTAKRISTVDRTALTVETHYVLKDLANISENFFGLD